MTFKVTILLPIEEEVFRVVTSSAPYFDGAFEFEYTYDLDSEEGTQTIEFPKVLDEDNDNTWVDVELGAAKYFIEFVNTTNGKHLTVDLDKAVRADRSFPITVTLYDDSADALSTSYTFAVSLELEELDLLQAVSSAQGQEVAYLDPLPSEWVDKAELFMRGLYMKPIERNGEVTIEFGEDYPLAETLDPQDITGDVLLVSVDAG